MVECKQNKFSTENLKDKIGPLFNNILICVLITVLAIFSLEECVAVQIILIYALCHFGTNLTFEVDGMSKTIYNSRWYCLPCEQQKMFILIVKQGQIAFFLDGFIFKCSLETFTTVSDTIFIAVNGFHSVLYLISVNAVVGVLLHHAPSNQ